MRKKIINFDAVRKIALELPGVEEDSAYGGRAFKVDGKLLACTPVNRSAEPGSLGVRIDINDRAHLLAEAPDVYYVTEHYVPYPMVLVRLSRVTPDVLRDLLRMAHKFVTAKPKSRRCPSAATRN
ncbi:MAG: MmcQ/YjbR family DNA-binding protein [Candidatus Acidiferrales bacterium]